MAAYYNEIDPFAAEWLRNLMDAGEIPAGDVDTRSIKDVKPDDLDGYTQCHFFAGIGGWSLALRLAGWPDDVPIWTGSCPCQPFSRVGRRKGTADDRHLWPDFRRLIGKRRPATVTGEQVESADGRIWLRGVRTDMEGMGYRFGAADLCAAGISAPHRRQRIFWVGDSNRARWHSRRPQRSEREETRRAVFAAGGQAGRLGDGIESRLEGHGWHEDDRHEPGRLVAEADGSTAASGAWAAFRVVHCADERDRRIPAIESGVLPVAHGLPRGLGRGRTRPERVAIGAARANRKGRLKGYGNAIVPQVAAEFIRAYMECGDA